jgi:hypothetical protein
MKPKPIKEHMDEAKAEQDASLGLTYLARILGILVCPKLSVSVDYLGK